MKKSWMIYFLATLWLGFSIDTRAQFDDDDYLPPPPGSGGGMPMGSAGPRNDLMQGGASSGSSDSSPTILSKDKKSKIAQASIDEITDKNYPELIESFDFNNAEINDVIKAIGELTGKNFILDSSVRGKITIIAPTKITVAEAYKAFLSALAVNHLTVVPSGGFYKIKSSKAAQKDNIETYSGDYFPNSDQMITRIIHLKYISAEQVQRELRVFNSADGDLQFFSSTNSLIIADYGSNIERVMKVINQLDVPGFEEKLVVMQIRNAKAKDMAELINKIVNKDSGSKGSSGGGSFSAGLPRFGASRSGPSQSGSAYFMVIPDDRTNSLIVVGNKQGVARVKKLVSQLDFKIKADENGGVHVYYVKNGDAEKISQTLSGIAKDSKPATSSSTSPSPGPGGSFVPQTTDSLFGGDVKITADKETNSLIITASKSDYDVVLDLLSKIDIQRNQVYVEAVILEMLLNDNGDWGLGYYNFAPASKGLGRIGFMPTQDLLTMGMTPGAGTGAIFSFAHGQQFEMKTPAGTQTITSTVGLLNFLKTTGRTNVLSTPQIMALDNEESEIEVGDEVAVGMTSTISNGLSQSAPQFKDATIKLKIKPFISPTSDSVRMKIDQKIVQPEAKGIANTISLSKRSVTTNIVVPDGDTAALGGLVKDLETEQITKVPLLGDIPILGWLFKSRKIQKQKTNLLILITPKIIRTLGDNHKLVDKKLDDRLDYVKQTGGRDPYGKVIDKLPRQAKRIESPIQNSEIGKPKPAQDEPPPKIMEIDTSDDDSDKISADDEADEPVIKSQASPEDEDGRVVE